MRLDLHCHSTYSDGVFPVSELVRCANDQGLEIFALSDHDTCAGSAEVQQDFRGTAVAAAEITATQDGRSVHLLAYDAERGPGWSALTEKLEQNSDRRKVRAMAIVARLEELGLPLDGSALVANRKIVGRPHIAQALVDSGAVKSKREAFDRYLKDGGPADVQIEGMSIEQVLEMVTRAGGVVALAHPHTSEAEEIFANYRGAGLSGIETYYKAYSAKQRRRWSKIARTYDLVSIGGSDFHGQLGSEPELGIDFPDESTDALKRWLCL